MKSKPRIVVVGSLVCDFVAKGPRLPRPGETVLGETFGMFPGGKGANQAVQAGRLGAEVYMVGRVGDDSLADLLLGSLTESGVATEFVKRDHSVKTAACCIHVDDAGNNAIIIVPEANAACCADDVDAAAKVLGSADILLCQLEIPLDTVAHAVGVAVAGRVRVILNPAPAQQVPAGLLSQVTLLTPNETEAELLAGVALPAGCRADRDAWARDAAQRLLACGPQRVIITWGERGALLADPAGERLIPSYPVGVVDTTAAGDAFNGALAVALGEGKEIEDAVAFANVAGALATTRAGAQPSLPWREEIERFRAQLP